LSHASCGTPTASCSRASCGQGAHDHGARLTADRAGTPTEPPQWVAREEFLTRFASRAADIRLRETSIPWHPTRRSNGQLRCMRPTRRSTSRGTSFASRDVEVRELRPRVGGVASPQPVLAPAVRDQRTGRPHPVDQLLPRWRGPSSTGCGGAHGHARRPATRHPGRPPRCEGDEHDASPRGVALDHPYVTVKRVTR
jgi:hypothetical protein